MIQNLDIIIPVHNEEHRIHKVNNWIRWMDRNTKNCSLILSLNGCIDFTEKKIKNIKSRYIKIIKTKKKGRGIAIINAIKNSKKEYFAIASVDDAWDKKFYLKAYKKIKKNNNLFCVYGPKDHPGSSQKRIFFRRFISFFSKIFLKILYSNQIDQDTQCIKLFRKNTKFNNKLIPYNYFFDTYFFLLNKNLNLKYENLPVRVKDNNKHSKMKLKLILEFIYHALLYRLQKLKLFSKNI